MPTSAHLNVLSLASYSMIFGMDWIYLHRTKVKCYDKAIECLDDSGEQIILQSKKKETSVRMVIDMQVNHSHRKGYVLFSVHIYSDRGKDVENGEVPEGTQFYNIFRIFFPKIF